MDTRNLVNFLSMHGIVQFYFIEYKKNKFREKLNCVKAAWESCKRQAKRTWYII